MNSHYGLNIPKYASHVSGSDGIDANSQSVIIGHAEEAGQRPLELAFAKLLCILTQCYLPSHLI